MKVFIVEIGEYSDRQIVAVFSDKKKAKDYANARNGRSFSIELDDRRKTTGLPSGMFAFAVSMNIDGNHAYCYKDDCYGFNPTKTCRYKDLFQSWQFARDKKHAIKIANERRIQHIANGTMDLIKE